MAEGASKQESWVQLEDHGACEPEFYAPQNNQPSQESRQCRRKKSVCPVYRQNPGWVVSTRAMMTLSFQHYHRAQHESRRGSWVKCDCQAGPSTEVMKAGKGCATITPRTFGGHVQGSAVFKDFFFYPRHSFSRPGLQMLGPEERPNQQTHACKGDNSARSAASSWPQVQGHRAAASGPQSMRPAGNERKLIPLPCHAPVFTQGPFKRLVTL
jgi:hypothetical protein